MLRDEHLGRRAVNKTDTDNSYQSARDLSQQPPLILPRWGTHSPMLCNLNPRSAFVTYSLSAALIMKSFTSKAQNIVRPHQAQIDVN
jgi:hypothetical protein